MLIRQHKVSTRSMTIHLRDRCKLTCRTMIYYYWCCRH